MTIKEIWLFIVSIGDIIGITGILSTLLFFTHDKKCRSRVKRIGLWFIKLGFSILALGLLWSFVRNSVILSTGSNPMDSYFPFWGLKDIGAGISVIGATMYGWEALARDVRHVD